ncbi:MAG TPA: DNA methyltransferase [Tepidisphaeraceae bacterium]|jgi:DNA modification methylase|nr:DNA methyltransferase [Tepidisphaeraceae bacterium]
MTPPKPSRSPFRKPPLRVQPTTLWDYPSQHYGEGVQGDPNYKGATPSYIIWNLLQRYTKPKDLVIDPCAGSGTTLDVARDLDRKALGYDVHPTRKDIFRVDARKLPPELAGKVDFVFIDPPYSTHLDYGPDPRDIGKLEASTGDYYKAMEQVIGEISRVLKPDRYMALYVSDSFIKGKGFYPIGFELFGLLRQKFTPVDIISVTRHNKTLEMGNYRKAAEEGNFFLRGFNYLFIFHKLPAPGQKPREMGPPGRSDN